MVEHARRAPRRGGERRLCVRRLLFFFCLFSSFPLVPPCWPGEQTLPGSVLEAPTQTIAAAASAAMCNPLATLGVLCAGKTFSIWEGPSALPPGKILASDKAAPIDPDILVGVEDKTEVRNAAENYEEARAYNYLLVQANETPAAALAKSARRDLTFAHLFEEPSKYRGQVVHLEGRLKRLRRFDAPRMAAKQGVPVIYEGWIFGDAYFSNPYCVIATAVPKSIPLDDALDHRVAFDGYFFKRYRYKAGDSWRDAPLLIGHALQDRQATSAGSDAGASFASILLPALLTILLTTVILVAGLHWWFRRGDRRVRMHLDMTRNANFVEPGLPADNNVTEKNPSSAARAEGNQSSWQ